MLKKMGISLSAEESVTLVKLIDRRSGGDLIHFTELLDRMRQYGYKIKQPEPDSLQHVSLPNLLLLECCSLEHL
jgi:hypothetical protein